MFWIYAVAARETGLSVLARLQQTTPPRGGARRRCSARLTKVRQCARKPTSAEAPTTLWRRRNLWQAGDETSPCRRAKGSHILHDSVIHSTNGASYDSLWQANARRAERSHREAEKKEEALKGLRKGRISRAAVARGHPHTHTLEREFAPAMGGELNENGVRLGVDFFTTLLQSVMSCLASHYLWHRSAKRLA